LWPAATNATATAPPIKPFAPVRKICIFYSVVLFGNWITQMGIVHHSKSNSATSEMGQKRTSKRLQSMSALPPKANISGAHWDVRFMP
ncbi:MAG: hypothetical protein WA838_11100, partial [Xanthobacteraceae bacterium]